MNEEKNKKEETPQTFEEFKNVMKDKYEKEVVNPTKLLQTSNDFFDNLVYDYSIRCLFIHFLDFQIYLKENNENPIPILPYFNKNLVIGTNSRGESAFDELLKNDCKTLIKGISKFKQFLKDEKNRILRYYFWNVTFPHMFCNFISNEYCEKAKKFLTNFLEDEDLLKQGLSSFIRHNYYFQDFFMKLYFVNSQKYLNDPIECIKQSLIKSLEKLTTPQLSILNTFYVKNSDECKKMFIYEIIIQNIKLWKYSPLYSPSKALFNDSDEYMLINILEKHFENPDNINNFFDSFKFKDILEKKITSYDINIRNLVINRPIANVATFFDLLIIEKFVASRRSDVIKKYIGETKPSYFNKKAFCFCKCNMNLNSKEVATPTKKSVPIDTNIEKNWNAYKQECIAHNIKPLEFLYKNQHQELIKAPSQEVAEAGLKLSYFEWKYYDDVDKFLRKENRALIPLKAVYDSMKSILQVYSIYYAYTFPFCHDNLIEENKNLYVNLYQKCFSTLLITDIFTDTERYKTEIQNAKTFFKDELNKRFNDLFITNYKEENLINIYQSYAKDVANGCNLNDEFKKSFRFYPEFCSYITKAQMVVAYDNYPLEIEVPEAIRLITIGPENDIDMLSIYESSGVFYYIAETMKSLLPDDKNNKKIKIGQFFAFISELCLLLPQFIEGSNSKYIMNKIGFQDDEIKLTRSIFYFSCKSDELTTLLISLLRFSFDEVKKLMVNVPNLSDYYNQIIYLMKNLGERYEEEELISQPEEEKKTELETKEEEKTGSEINEEEDLNESNSEIKDQEDTNEDHDGSALNLF